MNNGRKGDEPGYFLSKEFWIDRYRDFIAGKLSRKVTQVPKRVEKISKSDG